MNYIEILKQYIRIDTDDDDILLEQLQQGAETFLKNSGITVSYENPLYCTAINMLVANWYDNRDNLAGKDTISIQFKNILVQLAYSQRKDNNE